MTTARIHILIIGSAGVGKTTLARYFRDCLRKLEIEPVVVDDDGESEVHKNAAQAARLKSLRRSAAPRGKDRHRDPNVVTTFEIHTVRLLKEGRMPKALAAMTKRSRRPSATKQR